MSSFELVAAQLATDVDFFREHAPDIAELKNFVYTSLPTYYSSNGENNQERSEAILFDLRKRILRDVTNFPFFSSRGKLQVPMALLCEAKDDPEKILVIINYWRQLKADRQRELKTAMKRFYIRPNLTNERLKLVTKNNSAVPLSEPSSFSFDRRQYITPWGFRCLETCTQLAEALGLCCPGDIEKTQQACDLLRTANLEVPRSNCKAEDCIYPALARNHGYCCIHGLHFGPTQGRVNGRRGYLLLGDVYTRPYLVGSTTNNSDNNTIDAQAKEEEIPSPNTTPTVKKLTTCSCRNETCVGIGYSPTMIQFDIHKFPKELRDAIWSNSEALNMTGKTHFQNVRNQNSSNDENDELLTRSSVLRLAPWHFHPEHRIFQPDGSWKPVDSLRTTTNATTNTALSESDAPMAKIKEWKGILLPTYSPKNFLQEPIMKEYTSRKANIASTTDMLPSWCREYAKLEQGPSNISEVQRNFLWDRSIELEESLASKIVSFQTRERALEIELEKVRAKYNEKKFLKRRDKKRKRNVTNTAIENHKSKGTESTSNAKPSSSDALKETDTSNKSNQNRPKKKRNNNQMEKVVPNQGSEPLNETGINHHRDSHRMDQMHYSTNNHTRPPPPQQHHRHHPYPHSYPPHPHPQHLPHHHATAVPMELQQHHHQHYHHHHQEQQQDQQSAQQGPQYHQHAYQHHPQQHNGQTNQYGEASQDHSSDGQHQEQQRPRHYTDQQQQQQQQDWQRGYYTETN